MKKGKTKTELACGYKVAPMAPSQILLPPTCFLCLLATAASLSLSLLSPCFLLLSSAISTAFPPEGLAACSPFPQSSHCNPQTFNCWSHFCSSSPALTPPLFFKRSPGFPHSQCGLSVIKCLLVSFSSHVPNAPALISLSGNKG